MLNILLILQIIIAILLIIVILLQRTGADGVTALGGGSNMGLVNARTAANFLTTTTMVLAAIFMLNSLVLANLSSVARDSALTKRLEQQADHHNDAAPHSRNNPSNVVPIAP